MSKLWARVSNITIHTGACGTMYSITLVVYFHACSVLLVENNARMSERKVCIIGRKNGWTSR